MENIMNAYKEDREFFIGQETPFRFPEGAENHIYDNKRWIRVTVDDMTPEQEKNLLGGRVQLAPMAIGCMVLVLMKAADSVWVPTAINPRDYINYNGNIKLLTNRIMFKKNTMTVNYSVATMREDKQVFADLRKLEFDRVLYRELDAAMEKAMRRKFKEGMFEQQREMCYSMSQDDFEMWMERHDARVFAEIVT